MIYRRVELEGDFYDSSFPKIVVEVQKSKQKKFLSERDVTSKLKFLNGMEEDGKKRGTTTTNLINEPSLMYDEGPKYLFNKHNFSTCCSELRLEIFQTSLRSVWRSASIHHHHHLLSNETLPSEKSSSQA